MAPSKGGTTRFKYGIPDSNREIHQIEPYEPRRTSTVLRVSRQMKRSNAIDRCLM